MSNTFGQIKCAQRGARTPYPEIKSLMLYRLSQPTRPQLHPNSFLLIILFLGDIHVFVRIMTPQLLYWTQKGSAIHGRHSHYRGDAQRNTDMHLQTLPEYHFGLRAQQIGSSGLRLSGAARKQQILLEVNNHCLTLVIRTLEIYNVFNIIGRGWRRR